MKDVLLNIDWGLFMKLLGAFVLGLTILYCLIIEVPRLGGFPPVAAAVKYGILLELTE